LDTVLPAVVVLGKRQRSARITVQYLVDYFSLQFWQENHTDNKQNGREKMMRKTLVGFTIALLIAVSVLGWLYRAELKKAAKLMEQQKQLLDTLANKSKVIDELEKERQKMNELLKKRAEDYQKIEQETAAKVTKMRQELQELRRKYAEVEKFFSIPVPAEFIDWLREKDNDTNRYNKDTTAR
jgi:DNA repair exonuclease SbcCD ATPase subunit